MKIASQHEIVLKLCEVVADSDDPEMRYVLREIAADVAGIPRDNTVETRACDWANQHRAENTNLLADDDWPFWGYCRDKLRDMMEEHEESPERCAAILLSWRTQENVR